MHENEEEKLPIASGKHIGLVIGQGNGIVDVEELGILGRLDQLPSQNRPTFNVSNRVG